MKHIHNVLLILTSIVVVGGGLVPVAQADWDDGDPHKMHYPQLPDPNGWDVRISNARDPLGWIVADDWMCSETGPVGRVHFWVSWMDDVVDDNWIKNIHLSIHDNLPADDQIPWSRPGALIRDWDLGPAHFTWRHYGEGDQGWFDPVFEEYERPDHKQFYQINVSIPDPIIQEQGKIYWLDISVDLPGESELGKLGWKTSADHFEDDAVYWDPITQGWIELRDPLDQQISLDMAFVISVPEPGTFVLLGMGLLGLGCLSYRKRRATR